MCKSNQSPRVGSAFVQVGAFLSNKTSPAKVTTLSSALAGTLSHKVIAALMKYEFVY